MALMVSLQFNSTEYYLKVEQCTHSFTRFATQAPLPAVSGEPVVFTLDLGMSLEQISVAGIIENSGSPSKQDLETVVRTWWGYTNFSDSSDLPKLTIDSGQVYSVAIKQSEFKREGGIEDRWNMSMIFLVGNKI
jgi:hypothetical protein